MAENVGGAGNAGKGNDASVFRAILTDKGGKSRSILVLGFSGIREIFVRQLDASERAREVSLTGNIIFRRPS